RDQAAERRQAIVDVVHGAAACVGSDHSEESGVGDAEAYLLTFHVSASHAEARDHRITGLLRGVDHADAEEEEHRHRRQKSPALAGWSARRPRAWSLWCTHPGFESRPESRRTGRRATRWAAGRTAWRA